MKVLLILADGMRPDALSSVPKAMEYTKKSSYTMNAKTVFPSVTLPCHISLFHSVEPLRHGTTTNTYAPQVRPINGLCEVLLANKKKSSMFYNWEALRDVSRPGSMTHTQLWKGSEIGYDKASKYAAEATINYLRENDCDFTFLYLGYPDAAGHKHGWMGKEYMESVEFCWDLIDEVISTLDDEYTVFITADHGGHDRSHGENIPEDMIIPLYIIGKDFEEGKIIEDANITDIAPTIAKLLGVEADEDWDGKSLI